MNRFLLLSFHCFVLLLISCQTSPTGRRQLLLVKDPEMNEMGTQAFAEMKKQTPIERGEAVNRYVNCIVQAELAVTEDSTGVASWEVVVFKDSTPNAFALPGGKIGVHTGILPVAKTPGQLAAVIGHEIGHVIARHGNERVSQNQITNGGMEALKTIGKGDMAGVLGAGAKFGVLLPYSRAHESEADYIGLEIMAKAGFNPEESVTLWENMSALGGSKSAEILSTHPSDETRMTQLKSKMSDALQLFNSAKSQGKVPGCRL
ncbi:M48 family metallopeptidase [Leptospira idonii]|uniref:M48 family peptidase n=1 Tax=Leptospira idonii TaxID=1193500 RepID=A0A4V3JY56_9LEPT|nr:M48 family metallopeptidase [Leptospira idonii]TGN18596.1 M48 family peptidase [Leptospira idonii]